MLPSGAEAAGVRDAASLSDAAGGELEMAAASAVEAAAEQGRDEDGKGSCDGMIVFPRP